VFAEFRRVLRPGGPLLVGFHVGDDVEHTSQGSTGRAVDVDTHLRRPATVEDWLRDAGFTLEATLVMRPDADQPGAVVFATSGDPSALTTGEGASDQVDGGR
jgi:predicted methyltransferase